MNLSRLSTRLLAPLLGLIALVGCTGTQEANIPIMLVVGSVEPGGAQLQLFEDVLDPLANPRRNLVPVPGSVRPLPSPPVSVDVVDRNGERSELVVLDEAGTLHFFDLTDLPGSFTSSRTPVDVAALIPPAVDSTFCWQEVQVGGEPSGSGRFAALLDSCPDDFPDVYVVDLTSGQYLYALSEEEQFLMPIGIYLDQESDRLYYAADDFTDTLVMSLPITGDAGPEPLGTAVLNPAAAVDLAPLANGIGLLGDGIDSPLVVVPFEGTIQSPVDTGLASANRLLPDPNGNVELLVAFESERGAILDGLEDDDPEPIFMRETLADATLEPVQRFAYLLEVGGIEILDLFAYAEPPANRLLFVDLPGLDDPRVITWAFGTQTP